MYVNSYLLARVKNVINSYLTGLLGLNSWMKVSRKRNLHSKKACKDNIAFYKERGILLGSEIFLAPFLEELFEQFGGFFTQDSLFKLARGVEQTRMVKAATFFFIRGGPNYVFYLGPGQSGGAHWTRF
jgi:hypothetical protein